MIKIGDFSKLARVSVRMLRHYEKLELLIPIYVDKITGYRYYNAKQLTEINNIILLKEMGFSLVSIKELVEDKDNVPKLKEMLTKQREVIAQENESIKNRLLILDKTIENLNKETNIMEYTVLLKEMPQRHVISVRQVIDSYENEGKLWAMMGAELEKQAVKLANPCYGLAIFHDSEYREADVDVEVQLSVQGEYKDTETVIFKDVAPFMIASAIFEGDYNQFPKVTETILTWIADNNYEINGSHFSINHVSPEQEEDPNKWVTEVCIPIIKK